MTDLEYALIRLRAILADLESRTPQLPAGSPEAVADHENWMKEREQIRSTVHRAEWIALWTVPPEVQEVMNAIDARKAVLLNLKPIQKKAEAHS